VIKLRLAHQRFELASVFTISRGSKTHADVVEVSLERNGHFGRGECVPYPRYNETVADVMAALEKAETLISSDVSRHAVKTLPLPYAAKNALDCALWDLEAKETGIPASQSAGIGKLQNLTTAYTLSLDEPAAMAKAALVAGRPLLKLKLGREGDEARLTAVRQAVPNTRLIVDANEGWTAGNVNDMLALCHHLGVELVEQPLPQGQDDALRNRPKGVRVCADESAHGAASLPDLVGKYDAVNIKLDKTGGLTPALEFAAAAKAAGLDIMVGCMVASSLAMAPAFILAQTASVVDLDGPLLLKSDRPNGIIYDGGTMHPPSSALWG
jgi:L-Ala-D/L-Glu epimerase